jgi:crotonobetainyl-CoA:carnitine CoA-transferase CaiB-like acyl-CoA transferase
MIDATPPSRGALSGIRVIDLTQILAGPFCTQMLADHGAEVIKVEPPQGDETRRNGPYRADDALRAHGGYYASANRNKRGIAIDLKSEQGREILFKLIDTADAVVENYRSGVMDRLGLSYEVLAARNPKIVYAAIRGFGDARTGASPYSDWPAFDIVAQAMGGVMGITGPDAETPLKVGPGIGDLVPALMAAFGVVIALLEARASGKGQFVDVAMVDGIAALCERIIHQYAFTGVVPRPEGNRHPLLCPFGLFRCKNGWATIGAPQPVFWRHLCLAMGRPELIEDPNFSSNAARLARRDEVYDIVEDFTKRHTKAELSAMIGGKVPFGPVYDVSEIFEDPHFRARDMLVEVEQPGSAAPVTIAGVPVKLSRTPGGVRRRAPLLGEDTDAILASLGYGATEIAVFRAAGAVK